MWVKREKYNNICLSLACEKESKKDLERKLSYLEKYIEEKNQKIKEQETALDDCADALGYNDDVLIKIHVPFFFVSKKDWLEIKLKEIKNKNRQIELAKDVKRGNELLKEKDAKR